MCTILVCPYVHVCRCKWGGGGSGVGVCRFLINKSRIVQKELQKEKGIKGQTGRFSSVPPSAKP